MPGEKRVGTNRLDDRLAVSVYAVRKIVGIIISERTILWRESRPLSCLAHSSSAWYRLCGFIAPEFKPLSIETRNRVTQGPDVPFGPFSDGLFLNDENVWSPSSTGRTDPMETRSIKLDFEKLQSDENVSGGETRWNGTENGWNRSEMRQKASENSLGTKNKRRPRFGLI